MPKEDRLDVGWVWLYTAAVVTLGAWISPLLYNAGKALAEVSSRKTTNGPLESLAKVCRTADFPQFYQVSLLLAAAVLLVLWLEWLHARSGASAENGARRWLRRLLDRATSQAAHGQPLRKNPRALWHACLGFLLAAGLLLAISMALIPAVGNPLRQADPTLSAFAWRTLARSLALAVVMEWLFRGIAMGIFLRAMRPAAALGMCAAFFALALATIPPPGLNVADPDAAGTGFELLRLIACGFADWRYLCGTFAPLLALGGVLAYTRWRTASLWLPIGLHTGWLFAAGMLDRLTATACPPRPATALLSGGLLQHGLIPVAGILLAGGLAHYLTASNPADERSTHS